MDNPALEEIRKNAAKILKKHYPTTGVFPQDVGDSAGFRVHTKEGKVLKIDLEEIDKSEIF